VTKPFCMQCTAELFGPEAMAAIERNVAEAPPFSAEQIVNLRAIFQSARASRAASAPPQKKECGH
jgi:hypothetical protein